MPTSATRLRIASNCGSSSWLMKLYWAKNSWPGGSPLNSSTMVSATLWPVRSRSSSSPVARSAWRT